MGSHKTKERNIFLYEIGKDGESLVTKLVRLLSGGLAQVLLVRVSLGTVFLGDNLVYLICNKFLKN